VARSRLHHLISYIAPAAPATRRPAGGKEPSMRPEVGFTPAWFRKNLPIDFSRRWHTDPAYRRETVMAMRSELTQRFPGTRIGNTHRPPDLLTGTYGTCPLAAIYGIPIVYSQDKWPECERRYLTDEQFARLEPPDLDASPFFAELIEQVDWIARREDRVEGYVNWQGVLGNAQRLRGKQVFTDMVDRPDRAWHLFECITTTMIDAARRLHARQRASGATVDFFTVSNCPVNKVSSWQYEELLLPFDRQIAEEFGRIGIHNSAWTADPYFDDYASLPHLSYIDMGKDSDLELAREAFPDARRAIVYPPADLARKSPDSIADDFRRIARDYAPCDVVLADIDRDTPDERVLAAVRLCRQLSY